MTSFAFEWKFTVVQLGFILIELIPLRERCIIKTRYRTWLPDTIFMF